MDALFGNLDVDDDVAVIEKDPTTFLLTFTSQRLLPVLMQALLNSIDDGGEQAGLPLHLLPVTDKHSTI